MDNKLTTREEIDNLLIVIDELKNEIKSLSDEIEKLKLELVSEDDLALAKSSLVEQFPSVFGSKSGMLNVFVNDELSHKDPLYWQTYRDKINAI